MFSKGSKKGTVNFAVKPQGASKKVMLAGDFNRWQPVPMKKQSDGKFAATVSLVPGTYEYKFVIDDQWVVDPDNSVWAVNSYGTLNSVALIG